MKRKMIIAVCLGFLIARTDIPSAKAEGEFVSTPYLMMQKAREEAERISDSDRELLAKAVHAEAGNQTIEGRLMVANVILNRLENPDVFAGTIEGVLSQDGQFSTWPGAIRKAIPTIDDYNAVDLALTDYRDTEPLYFERSNGGNTWHSRNLIFLYRIDDHSFYSL